MIWIVLLAIVGVGVGVAAWVVASRRTSGEAEQKLRAVCLNDAAQAQRLMDFELGRAPGISREEAARRAVARRRRDNS